MNEEPESGRVGEDISSVAADRVRRLARRAAATLAWERVWPELVAILGLLGVFAIVSWLGVWLALPRGGRIAGVALFAAALLAVLFRISRLAYPSRAEGLARLDRDSGLRHRPASGLDDQLAIAPDDPATRALWQLHRRRQIEAAQRLRLKMPAPRMADRDRWAVRAAVLLGLVAAGFIAGPEKIARLVAAVDWRSDAGTLAKGFRIDAWIDPPPYTGKPPILLPADAAAAAGASPANPADPGKIQAPVGSTVVVRTSGDPDLAVEASGGLVVPEPAKGAEPGADGQKAAAPSTTVAAPKPAAPDAGREMRWTLKGDAKLVLRRGDRTLAAFTIVSIPDQPPVIALSEPAAANARGSLTLAYTITDDYGVVGAEARFGAPVLRGKPVTGRSLVEPPRLTLSLPSAPGGIGQATTTADLSDHPWAGARVTMTLAARDDGGNEGKSEPSQVTLPQRPFVKPLARALVEQRRNLVLAPDDHERVEAALDALMIAPEHFTPEASVYLGLRAADTRLKAAKNDDDLRGVADLLWEMALQIEDGDLSEAERALRNAEQRLRDAMQRGASDEEMRKLTQDLRAALDKFLNEMAQRQQRDQSAQSQRPSRTVTPQDLKSMLDRMDQMARSGDLADAQQMLDQLQSILENLKNARRDGSSDPTQDGMEQSLNELDQMTRDQQGLRDDTFQNGNKSKHRRAGKPKPGQQGQGAQGQQDPGDQADNGDDDDPSANGQDQGDAKSLEDRQRGLRERLDALRQRMKELGMSNEQGLEDAEGAMQEAQGDIGGGKGREAVEAQGRALDGLRRGAQGMAQQMQQNGQDGQAQNDGDNDGTGNPRGNQQSRRDPLDRPSRFDRDYLRGGLLNTAPGAAQRAQQVLEELRKRLSDPSRPPEELDYLERLLRRY